MRIAPTGTPKQSLRLCHAVKPFLDLDEAVHEFMLHQRSSRHSECTIRHYNVSLRHLIASLKAAGLEELGDVRPKHLRQLLIDLSEKMKPKTVHGIATDIKAFFSFHELENDSPSPMSRVEMPKQPQEILPPFEPSEIKRLLDVTEGKDSSNVRNKLIILVLLDSGIRLCELAEMERGAINPKTGIFKIMGKGEKERFTRVSPLTLKTLHKYLQFHSGEDDGPLWLGERGPMTYNGLAETVEKLGKRAKVHAHPHKFRRTCALTMLRNGCDLFSLQQLLGHSDLTILKRYVAQTSDDYLAAHAKFSPVQTLAR